MPASLFLENGTRDNENGDTRYWTYEIRMGDDADKLKRKDVPYQFCLHCRLLLGDAEE